MKLEIPLKQKFSTRIHLYYLGHWHLLCNWQQIQGLKYIRNMLTDKKEKKKNNT